MANNRKINANPKLIVETPKGCIYRRTITRGDHKGEYKMELKWNEGFGRKYKKDFKTAQENFDAEVLKFCDKYVPMDTGILKNSVQIATDIGSGELVWDTPYAQAAYYKTGTTNGLRGKKWGHRCKADNMQYFKKYAKGLMK